LRFHRIDLGFYNAEGKVIKVSEVILEDQESTTITVEGGIPADTVAILPNYNDFSFIKVILDTTSQTWFESNINSVTEPLAQGLIVRSLYDGVRDARYKVSSFIKFNLSLIEASSSNQVTDLAYRLLSSCTSFIPDASYEENIHAVYQVTRKKLVATECPQFALSLIQKLLGYAFHLEDVQDLKTWLEGTNEDLKSHDLSIDQKWTIVYKINARAGISAEDGKAAFDALFAQDESDSKKNQKLKIEAVNTPAEGRAALQTEYFNKDTKWSYVELEHSIGGFNSSFITEEVRKPLHDVFFANILEALRIRSRQVAEVSHPFLPQINPFLDHLALPVPKD
jgi:hypothetical protein